MMIELMVATGGVANMEGDGMQQEGTAHGNKCSFVCDYFIHIKFDEVYEADHEKLQKIVKLKLQSVRRHLDK
jgi:hypothetical protein